MVWTAKVPRHPFSKECLQRHMATAYSVARGREASLLHHMATAYSVAWQGGFSIAPYGHCLLCCTGQGGFSIAPYGHCLLCCTGQGGFSIAPYGHCLLCCMAGRLLYCTIWPLPTLLHGREASLLHHMATDYSVAWQGGFSIAPYGH